MRLPGTSLARRLVLCSGAVALGLTLASCTDEPEAEPKPPVASQTVASDPPPGPTAGACYPLPFETAVAPTSDVAPVPCGEKHTSETVAVGTVDAVVDGHLLAIDSATVQAKVAKACPQALIDYVGGSQERLRLSMIRPIWFTPSVEESDAGAEWYRCDAVLLAGTSTLAQLTGSLKGALRGPELRDRYAMCGTAAPDAENFERVLCSAKHSWRAIDIIAFDQGSYPGEKQVRAAGRARCEDAAADLAEDPLQFQWGYEWPTREQWQMGQTFGRCWTPEPSVVE